MKLFGHLLQSIAFTSQKPAVKKCGRWQCMDTVYGMATVRCHCPILTCPLQFDGGKSMFMSFMDVQQDMDLGQH